MRPVMLRYRLWCVLTLTALLVLPANTVQAQITQDRALAAGLAPHKALYDIKLVSTKSGSQVVNISGQMFYEWRPVCDAWISGHRFDLTYEYADGPAMRVTSDFSTYEALDGMRMNFTSRRKRDGDLFEEFRGHADVRENRAGAAIYSIPAGVEQDIPADVLFPMGHTLGLLDAVRRNDKFYNATIFDGSDDGGPVNVNTFIGKVVNGSAIAQSSEKLDKTLLSPEARQVQLAFFPLKDKSGLSEYEMDLTFHNNGVISAMLVKYEDFSVSQTLKALEKIEPENCDDQ